jgi:hypothetical protein
VYFRYCYGVALCDINLLLLPLLRLLLPLLLLLLLLLQLTMTSTDMPWAWASEHTQPPSMAAAARLCCAGCGSALLF